MAFTEDFLPMNRGITVWGKTTTSLSGRRGIDCFTMPFDSAGNSASIIMKHLAYLIIFLDSDS